MAQSTSNHFHPVSLPCATAIASTRQQDPYGQVKSGALRTVTCCRQETYHTQGRGEISLVTRMQNVENSRKKYRAKDERGSFYILRTAVVDRSHRFMQWHSWSILLDSMGYRLVLCIVLTGKLRKRTAKRESSLEVQRDWSIYTNKELEEDECIM